MVFLSNRKGLCMTIDDYIHAETNDVYVDPTTRAILKRCHRSRKGKPTEDELVPLKLENCTYGGYPRFRQPKTGKHLCISYIYAEAFPTLVQNWEDHLREPDVFCELDHINGVHDTIESNYPENLRWLTPTANRGRKRTNKDMSQLSEKELAKIIKRRERYHKRREDPEWLAKTRKKDTETKLRYYYEHREERKQQTERLNEELAKLAAKSLSTPKK